MAKTLPWFDKLSGCQCMQVEWGGGWLNPPKGLSSAFYSANLQINDNISNTLLPQRQGLVGFNVGFLNASPTTNYVRWLASSSCYCHVAHYLASVGRFLREDLKAQVCGTGSFVHTSLVKIQTIILTVHWERNDRKVGIEKYLKQFCGMTSIRDGGNRHAKLTNPRTHALPIHFTGIKFWH